ncbi:erythromycin esterase family protein [Hanstruepera flava]|uniref:erythromycin esterase family protein n=1 Tax=Hanstruepera flava TaxID=2930218 RepID=UPI002028D15B|nr:erythromycin esterase family protein [Hanstruepera flava]
MKINILLVFLGLALNHQNVISQNSTKTNSNAFQSLAQDIQVNANYTQGNWQPVLHAIDNKSMVLLGELNHGSKEIFITKNELIQQLHQQLNFDVILFESGLGEIGTIESQKDTLNSKDMTNGFFWGWRNKSFEELMQYAKNNNISVAGFDVQKTGRNFSNLLTHYLNEQSIDNPSFHNIEQRFDAQKQLLTNRKAVYDSLKTTTKHLIADYKSLSEEIQKVSNNSKTYDKQLIKRTIENRIQYLKYFLDFTKTKDYNKRWKERDSMMAANVEWLMDTFYKDKKIILVAHNFHIAKFNTKEDVMGEFLAHKYGSRMYVLGVFAGSGSFANNSGKETAMKPIEQTGTDIKSLIGSLDGKVNFIDIPKEETTATGVFFQPIIINDTFIDLYGTNQLILSKHFDGLLLLDKISPPE